MSLNDIELIWNFGWKIDHLIHYWNVDNGITGMFYHTYHTTQQSYEMVYYFLVLKSCKSKIKMWFICFALNFIAMIFRIQTNTGSSG